MVRLTDRRSFLTAGTTAGVITIAGCLQDSESTGNENGDAGTDEPDASGGNGNSTDGEENPADDSTSDESNGDADGASFNLDLTVDQLPDAFESLIIEFTGFEFFDVRGSTLARESDPVQVDLVELVSSGESTDLMETTVPAGEYDSITYFIAVTDTTMASGDNEQTFRSNEDGEVLSNLTEPESFDVESSESITLTAQLSVEDAFDHDWKFMDGYSINRES